MKSMVKYLVLVCLVLFSVGAQAQCAMCRASIENNVSNGDTSIGASLNTGILYLLAMPYLLAVIYGYLWYKKSRKNALKMKEAIQRKRRIANL